MGLRRRKTLLDRTRAKTFAELDDPHMMDGAHYRKRADEVRAEADRSTLPDIRSQLLSIAEQYDMLARQADNIAAGRRGNSN